MILNQLFKPLTSANVNSGQGKYARGVLRNSLVRSSINSGVTFFVGCGEGSSSNMGIGGVAFNPGSPHGVDAFLENKVNENTPQIPIRCERPNFGGNEGGRVSAGKNTLGHFDKIITVHSNMGRALTSHSSDGGCDFSAGG